MDSMCFPWQQQVHRANEALKQLGFAFLSYLEQGARNFSVFLQLRQIFCRQPLLSYWRFFFSDIKTVLDVSTGIVGTQHAPVEWAKFGITGVVD